MRKPKFICVQPDDETWKPIPKFETFYEVSNLGRVRSLERVIERNFRNETYIRKATLLKPSTSRGYLNVKLYDGKAKGTSLSVHRLVALCFIPNIHKLSKVNHINGNKLDNKASNLEWCTHNYNVKHAYDTNLKKRANFVGSANKTAKLNEEIVKFIREEYSTGESSYPKLAKKYNISTSNIYSIIKKQTWTHV